MSKSKWYEDLSISGPLTRAEFETMGSTFYDDTNRRLHEIAIARGIKDGDFLKVVIAETSAPYFVEPPKEVLDE